MIKHPSSGPRLVAAAAAVIGLLVLSVAPVAAATTPPGDTSYSQSGSSAEVFASSCASNGDDTQTCSDQQIYVFIGKMTDSLTGRTHTSQVCASLAHYTFSELTGEFVGTPSFEQGCRVDVPIGTIKIDAKLHSATLVATHVTIEDQTCEKFGCDPGSARNIVVAASWAGFGPLMTSKSHSSSNDGTCRSKESFKGSNRSADVVGSLDGQAIAGDLFGNLFSGRYSFQSSCTEV